ncbi:HNH endonuclease [Ktedonospora formicarum]|uniref:HNH endonuclease signature motif containing protein n=1 Tax=Ktedonospora formicarum TaxID=2778364 RepID=UPI001C691056|nr:HNH endonuclease [Ktedonospora formicarum]
MPFSPQIVAIGALLLLILLFVLWLLLGRRRRHRRKRHHEAIVPRRRRGRDHGARIAKKHGKERSGEWSRVQDEHLLREPACRACGYKGKKVQVHHIKPFHLHPELELDPSNLITLCQVRGKHHHMLLGHLNLWASYNAEIEHDVKHFYGKSARQIKANLEWKKKVLQRP